MWLSLRIEDYFGTYQFQLHQEATLFETLNIILYYVSQCTNLKIGSGETGSINMAVCDMQATQNALFIEIQPIMSLRIEFIE